MNELWTDSGSETAPTIDPRMAAIAMLDQMQSEASTAETASDEGEAPSTDEVETVEGDETEAQEPVDEGQEQPSEEPSQEPETAQKEPEKKDKLSSRFACLAREEKRIRAQRDELKRHQEELRSFKAAVEKIKTDPLGALQELGIEYDTLTRSVLSGGKPDPADEIKELRERQEAWIREQREAQERQEQARVEQAFTQAKREIASLASSSSERFPLVAGWDPNEVAESAFQIIEQTYNKTGHFMSYDDALQEIENRLDSYREKLLKAKPVAPAQKQPPRSITNRVASQQGTAARELSPEERRMAAIKFLDSQSA